MLEPAKPVPPVRMIFTLPRGLWRWSGESVINNR
jgi:hypothetical protein